MSKNGFTLAELLGVIVILSFLGLIAITATDRNIVEGRKKTCQAQERNIIEAAKTYLIDYSDKLPTTTTTNTIINVKLLEEYGYLEEKLINPMTDKEYQNNTHVEIKLVTAGTNKYKYTVVYDTANNDKACS